MFCMEELARETERMRECLCVLYGGISQRDRENERMSCVLYGGISQRDRQNERMSCVLYGHVSIERQRE